MERIEFGYKKYFKKDNKRPPSFRLKLKYKSFTLKQAGQKLIFDNQVMINKKIFKFYKLREIEG